MGIKIKLKIPDELADVLNTLQKKLFEFNRDGLLKLVLYGSWATGRSEPNSDVDLLMQFQEVSDDLEEKVNDIIYEIMWEKNFNYFISPYILNGNTYNKLLKTGSTFLANIEDEGIILWENTEKK